MCLERLGGAVHVSTNKTTVMRPEEHQSSSQMSHPVTADEGLIRCTFTPCSSNFLVKDIYTERRIMDDVYHTSPKDNEVAYSIEDRRFTDIMEQGIHKNELGNWELPLPFRSSGVRLPDNREHAIKRFNNLRRTFIRRPKMKRDYFQFMEKLLKRGHAVQLTEANKVRQQDRVGPEKRNVWYLPHFGVYHPNKPDKIRVVFDSSIKRISRNVFK